MMIPLGTLQVTVDTSGLKMFLEKAATAIKANKELQEAIQVLLDDHMIVRIKEGKAQPDA